MDTQEIKSLFERLKDATTKPEEVAQLCEKYLSDTTPTYQLSIMGATTDPYNMMPFLKDRATGLPIIKQLAGGLTSMLHERGYRNNIETHQEHCLMGSSGSGLNPGAGSFPYTVGAILNNEITVEEARKARKLEMWKGAVGSYWGVEHWLIGATRMLLPLIDDSGKTIQDPILFDKEGNVLAYKLADGSPYKRN